MAAALLCLAILAGGPQARADKNSESTLRKLAIATMAISSLYVDSVDDTKLAEDAIRGMLEKLDPHSSYSTPKEVKALTEPLQGNFEGVGVQFNMLEDTLLVVQTVNGGPSEKVGILAGDRFVTVNDTAIAGVKMSKEDIMHDILHRDTRQDTAQHRGRFLHATAHHRLHTPVVIRRYDTR